MFIVMKPPAMKISWSELQYEIDSIERIHASGGVMMAGEEFSASESKGGV